MHTASRGSPGLRSRTSFPLSMAVVALALFAAIGIFGSQPQAAHADPSPISEGYLNWGVKLSFRNYVGNSGITASDGAVKLPFTITEPSPGFMWPVVSGTRDEAAGTMDIQFGGSVRFLGHEGALDLTISNPRVVISSTEQRLYADVRSLDTFGDGEFHEYDQAYLLDLNSAGLTITDINGNTWWENITSTLTAAGVAPFANFYTEGTAMDPVALCDGSTCLAPADEGWTLPGTPSLSLGSPVSVGTTQFLFADPFKGFLYRFNAGVVTALDAETLEVVGSAAYSNSSAPSHLVQDPVTGEMFFNSHNAVYHLRWDDEDNLVVNSIPEVGFCSHSLNSIAWDHANQKLYLGNSNASCTFVLTRTESGWASQSYGPIRNATDTANFGGTIHGWWVGPDGTPVVLRRTETGLRAYTITFGTTPVVSADFLSLTTVANDSGPFLGEANGSAYVAHNGGATRIYLENGTYKAELLEYPYTETAVMLAGGTLNVSSTFDPVSHEIFRYTPLPTHFVVVFRDGAALPPVQLPWTETYPQTKVAALDGVLFFIVGSDLYRIEINGYSPTVTASPEGVTVSETAGTATFTAAATGTPTPTAQWQVRLPGSQFWTDLPGETGTSLVVPVAMADDGKQYRAVFTNAGGSIATDAALLTVTEGEPEPGTDASQTITTTIVSSGGLSISVGSTQAALPTPVLNGAGDALVSSGALNPVTVTDQRSANPGWNLNGQVSAFTSDDNSFGGEHLGWTPEVVSQSGSQNVSAGAAVAPGGSLSTGAGLALAPAGAGVGTAVVGAGLELSVPTTTAPGDYSAILTLTVI